MSIIGKAVTFGGGGEPVLLWTNPNPNTSFAAQTITVLGDYDAYIVEVRNFISGGQYQRQIVPNIINTNTHPNGFFFDFTTLGSYSMVYTSEYRTISNLNNGAFAFTVGRHRSTYESFSYGQNNQYVVPTRIWGVKWTI